jgi:peptidyl-prolyl cis-trans isomerase SurA
VASNMMKTKVGPLAALVVLGIAAASAATAQDQGIDSTRTLNLPSNPIVFGTALPSVVKATAIVNGEVITQTDIDQRVALLAIANGGQIPAGEIDRLRQQVLRNLIDETLQIQAATAAEIKVTEADIDRTVTRVAGNVKQTPEQMAEYLKANGSSIRSIRRQIHGEIAWRRLQSAKIESGVSVGDEEVKEVISRLEASKGTEEYRIGEIYLSAPGGSQAQAMENANKILEQLRQGASFVAYARQFSEASTAAVGGDLGWVRPEQLPEPLAAAVRNLQPGQVSVPIAIPGGVSIVAVQDKRKVLTADPRNAELNLKQISVSFPKGTTSDAAEPIVARFAMAAQNVGGCGGAEKIAADFNGEVVQSDAVKLRDLPPALQEMMLPMQVGQATRPFGSLEEGVRVLVICGRDEVAPNLPTYDQVLAQMSEERVNMRARRYLRDLRRDAVIDFR